MSVLKLVSWKVFESKIVELSGNLSDNLTFVKRHNSPASNFAPIDDVKTIQLYFTT